MSLEDRRGSGHPLQYDTERIKILIKDKPPLICRELSAILRYNQSAIDRHSHDIGKVNKLGTWLPHQLTSDSRQQTIIICNFLLSKCKRHRFLQQVVSNEEKWLRHVEHSRKCQWVNVNPEGLPQPVPKNDVHRKIVMLSI